MNVVGILLAAGRGTRYGGDKRLAPLRGEGGEPVAIVACRSLRTALPVVLAVVRPGDDALGAQLRRLDVRVLECTNADAGMGASLACGVAAAKDADGWIIALADMPWVAPATVARVADALRNGASIVAPYHRGRRGHPVGFGARHREALLALGGDDGARSVIAAHAASLTRVDVDDAGVLRDVDRPEDLSTG